VEIVDIIMSCAKNSTFIRKQHFIDQLELRQNNIVPDNDGILKIMSTEAPALIEKQTGDKFKLFYNIDINYDLIIVISQKSFSPDIIYLITVYQQEVKRRPGN
jgi:hypothetical protein